MGCSGFSRSVLTHQQNGARMVSIIIVLVQYALSQQSATHDDANCRWLLNQWGYITRRFTRLPVLLQLQCVQSPKKPLIDVSVDCVGCIWYRGCNYHWMIRLGGCIARCQWHLTLSSSFVTYCVTVKHTADRHANTIRGLFTITFRIARW